VRRRNLLCGDKNLWCGNEISGAATKLLVRRHNLWCFDENLWCDEEISDVSMRPLVVT